MRRTFTEGMGGRGKSLEEGAGGNKAKINPGVLRHSGTFFKTNSTNVSSSDSILGEGDTGVSELMTNND